MKERNEPLQVQGRLPLHPRFVALRTEYDELSKKVNTQEKRGRDEIADVIYQFATQKYDAVDWKEDLGGGMGTIVRLETLGCLVSVLECAVKIKRSSLTSELRTELSQLHKLSEGAPGSYGPRPGMVKIGVIAALGIAVVVALMVLTVLVHPAFFLLIAGCIGVGALISFYMVSHIKPVEGSKRVGFSKELYELAINVERMTKVPESRAGAASTPWEQEKIGEESSFGSLYPSADSKANLSGTPVMPSTNTPKQSGFSMPKPKAYTVRKTII